MTTDPAGPATVDEYIAGFPPEVRDRLEEVRAAIREMVPEAGEKISYRIPTFTLGGKPLVYFAGHTKHIGVYPAPVEHPELGAALAPYAKGKGTVQFPLDRPIPFDVVRKIVRFRVEENEARAAPKRKKKA
ncbi:MAG TPA: DUF1801 domain-containing protein [Longimicrobium sp.]|nr:DUF1801 domain-containing protein [Longimicrobium sp.]